MKSKPTFIRTGLLAVLLSFQLLTYASVAQAVGNNAPPANNAPANNAPANNANSAPANNPQATYVGRGVESSIRALLCAPSDSGSATTTGTGSSIPGLNSNATVTTNPAGNDLTNCINRGYKFALAFGAVAAVFFVVIAGYMYMVGGEKGKEEAKSVLLSVIVGFLIMLSSFVLLKQINPTLVAFRTIQPPQLQGIYFILSCADAKLGENCVLPNGSNATGDGTGGGTPVGGGGVAGCTTKEQGGCSKSIISQCPEFANQMDAALRACNQESGGGQMAIASTTDQCTVVGAGKKVSFSWGLWQLNIVAGSAGNAFPECNGVLKKVGGPWDSQCLGGTCGRTCSFGSGGETAFNACTRALSDPNRNTRQACVLYNERVRAGRPGWGPWPYTRRVCHLP